ncbi:nicotinate-nicotinamide nucleotide adenylyltransferase [Acinetobacter soli]|uniref:nicotinate-nicotinamide nucleotide adenylyltransferase n=1 Tax=Acinetobacter soli TaxID=487316 RepID=UPI00124F9F9A|nr:nicotinate-nicotinamide nucleotide adenylyltransferase [Acinetobacter soli]
MYTFDYLVFIGRFQPFHLAHLETIQIALQQSRQVIIALGSAQAERNIKNPFLAAERQDMILSNFTPEQQTRILFAPIIDVYDDKKWVEQVKSGVYALASSTSKIGLIGHFKDESSYYLKLFPEWHMVELDSLKQSMSATPLREAFYEGCIDESAFPQGTIAFLKTFQKTDTYRQLQHKFSYHDSSNL